MELHNIDAGGTRLFNKRRVKINAHGAGGPRIVRLLSSKHLLCYTQLHSQLIPYNYEQLLVVFYELRGDKLFLCLVKLGYL